MFAPTHETILIAFYFEIHGSEQCSNAPWRAPTIIINQQNCWLMLYFLFYFEYNDFINTKK
jgi:hypothetical protein